MVVIWSENARNDLKNYYYTSKIITEGKVKKYTEDLVNYSNILENFHHLGKEFIVYKILLFISYYLKCIVFFTL